jgi:hypothetical protein
MKLVRRQTKNAPLKISGASLGKKRGRKEVGNPVGSRLPADFHGYKINLYYEEAITKLQTKFDKIVKMI